MHNYLYHLQEYIFRHHRLLKIFCLLTLYIFYDFCFALQSLFKTAIFQFVVCVYSDQFQIHLYSIFRYTLKIVLLTSETYKIRSKNFLSFIVTLPLQWDSCGVSTTFRPNLEKLRPYFGTRPRGSELGRLLRSSPPPFPELRTQI